MELGYHEEDEEEEDVMFLMKMRRTPMMVLTMREVKTLIQRLSS